jgi:hypothetical protein
MEPRPEAGAPQPEAVPKAVPRPGWAAALVRLLAFFGLALAVAFALDFSIKHGMRSVTTSELGAPNLEMSGRVNSEIIQKLSTMSPGRPSLISAKTARGPISNWLS